jgi:hypothetical protein
MVAPLEMKEGTTLGARTQSAIRRAAVLYKLRLSTFNFLTFIWKFLILRIIHQGIIRSVYVDLHVKHPMLGLIKLIFSLQNFGGKKYSDLIKMLPSWSRVLCWRTDGRTDMTKPVVGFAILRRRLKTPNERSLCACGVLKHEKKMKVMEGSSIANSPTAIKESDKDIRFLKCLNMYCVNWMWFVLLRVICRDSYQWIADRHNRPPIFWA